MDLKNIGNRIEERRNALHLRQEDLAEMSGVTVRSIYKIEQGKANPAYNTLMKICAVLGLELTVQIKNIS